MIEAIFNVIEKIIMVVVCFVIVIIAVVVILVILRVIFAIKDSISGRERIKKRKNKKKGPKQNQEDSQENYKNHYICSFPAHSACEKETDKNDKSKLEYDPSIPFFEKVETTMSPGETFVFSILSQIVDPNKYNIITQVQYSKYLKPNSESAFSSVSASKIKGKSADFGIETKHSQPVMFIEYDDKTHQEEDRKQRDNYLFHACKNARLPRLAIDSKYFNSSILRDEFNARKRLYKLLQLNGNPLNLPDLTCRKCGRELNVIAGSFGTFLAHNLHDSCHQKENIFYLR